MRSIFQIVSHGYGRSLTRNGYFRVPPPTSPLISGAKAYRDCSSPEARRDMRGVLANERSWMSCGRFSAGR
jgi:hypothetical protein